MSPGQLLYHTLATPTPALAILRHALPSVLRDRDVAGALQCGRKMASATRFIQRLRNWASGVRGTGRTALEGRGWGRGCGLCAPQTRYSLPSHAWPPLSGECLPDSPVPDPVSPELTVPPPPSGPETQIWGFPRSPPYLWIPSFPLHRRGSQTCPGCSSPAFPSFFSFTGCPRFPPSSPLACPAG